MQALFFQSAFIFLNGAALVAALIAARRGRVAPLVVLGAVVLTVRGLGSVSSYFALTENVSPIMQVLSLYARITPNTVLLVYACMMLARRYKAARDNDFVRVWFGRALYVHAGVFLLSMVGDLVWQVPVLEGTKPVPLPAFLFEAPGFALGIVYAAVAALVFFGAARTGAGPPRLSQRLQNLFWGIALAGYSGLLTLAVARQGIRALYPEAMTQALLERLSQAELVPFAALAGGIVAGSFAYYVQGSSGRFVERFLSFLELVGDLVEELANAPVLRGRAAIPYEAMREAAGEEFLGLSESDRRRADNAFRIKAVREHRPGRLSRRRLSDLARAYEDELREPVLSVGLREEAAAGKLPSALPATLGESWAGSDGNRRRAEMRRPEFSDAVALALKAEEAGWRPEANAAPEWERLAYAAMADAGLVADEPPAKDARKDGSDVRKAGDRILDAYHLARYKVTGHRSSSAAAGRLDDREAGA